MSWLQTLLMRHFLMLKLAYLCGCCMLNFRTTSIIQRIVLLIFIVSQGSFFVLSGISGHCKYIPIGSQHGNLFKFVAFISKLVLSLTITTCTYRIFSLGSIVRYLYLWTTLLLSHTHTHNLTQSLRLSQVLTASIWWSSIWSQVMQYWNNGF